MSAIDVVSLLLIGVLAGLMVGVMGVGGGAPVVVLTSLILGYSQHLAQGTALLVIVPTAVVAAYSHHRSGFVQWRWALALSIGGVAGALLGSWLALGLRGVLLRYLFVVFLGVMGFRMIQIGRSKRRPSTEE